MSVSVHLVLTLTECRADERGKKSNYGNDFHNENVSNIIC